VSSPPETPRRPAPLQRRSGAGLAGRRPQSLALPLL